MDTVDSAEVFLLDDFRLDRRGLFRMDQAGIAKPVAVSSRGLDLLRLLVERQGELVSKDAIIAAVWPGAAIEESNLTVQISALRRVLDQNRANGSCIQTVPGRGYRSVAPVTQSGPGSPSVPSAPSDNNSASFAFEEREAPDLIREAGALSRPRARNWLWNGILAAVVGVLALAAAVTLVNWHSEPARQAPRLSIAVLPFTNLSDDKEQQYFADGITDDLTTDLSRIPNMIVISHNTALTYRNKAVDTKEIGHELNVRYVVEGTVRRSGNQVRVNANLIDAATEAHLWAERFDRDALDLFEVQNEITTRIATALNIALVGAESVRPTEHPDVLDYILRGRAIRARPKSRENYTEAIRLFERALELNPQSSEAQGHLAITLANRLLDGMGDPAGGDLERADMLSRQAVAASPNSPLAHVARGAVLRAQRRCEKAIPEYERAIALDRNWAHAYASLGWCKFLTASIDEAMPLYNQAIRLSPREPGISVWYRHIGEAHLVRARTDEAIVWFEKARSANPRLPLPLAYLASSHALRGETERAATELAELQRRFPGGHYSSIARMRAVRDYGVPKVEALFESTFFAGLRKAGMPEE